MRWKIKSLVEQGKIVAKLLPTEARLRDGRPKFRNAKAKHKKTHTEARLRDGRPKFRNAKSKTKKLITRNDDEEREKKGYSGRLLTASGGRQ